MASNIESKTEVQTGKGLSDNANLLHAKLTEGLFTSPNNASPDRVQHSTANLHPFELVDHTLPPPGSGKTASHTGGGDKGAAAAGAAADHGARAAARAAAEAAAGAIRR